MLIQLGSLPPEIFARICDYLGKHDMVNVRVAFGNGHGSTHVVTECLAKNFLDTVVVVLSAYGLRCLQDLCAHKVFGRYVRNIQLIVPHDSSLFLGPLMSASKRARAKKDLEAERQIGEYTNTCRQTLSLKSNVTNSTRAIQSIHRALVSLIGLGLQDMVTFRFDHFNELEDCHTVIGRAHAFGAREIATDYYDTARQAADIPMSIIFEAAQRCGFGIRALEIVGGCLSRANPLMMPALAMPTSLPFVLAGLRCCRLIFHKSHPETEMSKTTARTVAWLLEAAHALETVTLDCPCDDDTPTPSTFRLSTFLPADSLLSSINAADTLTDLRLGSMVVSEDQLYGTLDRHRYTLNRLHLDKVSLFRGTWGIVIHLISTTLTGLDSLFINELSQAVQDVDGGGFRGVGYEDVVCRSLELPKDLLPLDVRGTERLRKGLEELTDAIRDLG